MDWPEELLMKKNLRIAIWFTLVTTVLFGLVYPLVITGLSQLLFPDKANGQLIERNGKLVGRGLSARTSSGPAIFIHGPRLPEPDTIPRRAADPFLVPRTRRY
jgi:K+-transporting ATPase c subunit